MRLHKSVYDMTLFLFWTVIVCVCVCVCVCKVWKNTAQILRERSEGDAVRGDFDLPSYWYVLFSFILWE